MNISFETDVTGLQLKISAKQEEYSRAMKDDKQFFEIKKIYMELKALKDSLKRVISTRI